MKITQKVIDFAMTKLPRRPEPLNYNPRVAVCGNDVGINNGEVVVVGFNWSNEWNCWVCEQSPVPEDKPALNVVELKPHTKEPGDNVVQRLEQALELARKGEIANLAIVAVCNDGDVMDCWANQSNALTMVGGLESLKFEFMNGVIEKRD